ncbi:hypothetical protein [Phyllobacterium sp. 1468]|uniref:hypothetical protein n=1 Tax=Phyllobacterium sp. 1468 TaxID=2817759 RepID=UPI0038620D93
MPICILVGTYITAVRTSGSAVQSVRELARRNAKVATVVGAGVQASQHLHLLPRVRDFQAIRLVRTSDQQSTIHKAMGVAMEDMVAADLAYREAKRLCVGQSYFSTPLQAYSGFNCSLKS